MFGRFQPYCGRWMSAELDVGRSMSAAGCRPLACCPLDVGRFHFTAAAVGRFHFTAAAVGRFHFTAAAVGRSMSAAVPQRNAPMGHRMGASVILISAKLKCKQFSIIQQRHVSTKTVSFKMQEVPDICVWWQTVLRV